MDTKMPTKVRKWADHTMGANRMVSHCIPMWEQCSCHPVQLQSLQHMWPSRHLLHALRYPSHFDSPDYQKPPTLLGLPLSFSPCPDLQSEVGFLLPHRTLSLCTSLQFSRVPITNTGSLSPISKELFPIWALGSAAGYNWLPASIWFVWISSAHSSLRVTPGLHLSAPQHVGHKAGHSERQPQDTMWVTHTVMLWFVAPAALGFFSFCFLS